MAELNAAGEARHNLAVLARLGDGLEYGPRELVYGLELRRGERDAREGGEGAGDHAVGPGEGVVVRDGDAAFDRAVVHYDGAREGYRGHDDAVELDEERRVIGDGRALGEEPRPAGEGALLGPGELYLLHAGYQRVAHAALLGGQLHAAAAQAHLDEEAETAEKSTVASIIPSAGPVSAGA